MSRSLKIFLWALLPVAGIASLSVTRSPREPEYAGQPLSAYLSSLTYSQVRLERDARDAIRAIGSNAVPHLIKILDARESRFKTWFNKAADRQSLVRIRFRFSPLAPRQIQAAMACQELGPASAPAIPSLARLIDDPQAGHLAVAALAEIGPQTFPLLTNAMSSRQASTRLAAVGHLRLARPPERAVPPLLVALRSSEPRMRTMAAESLGALGLHSQEVITVLTGLLDDPDTAVRVNAARSLGWSGSVAAGSIPKLLNLYSSLDGRQEQLRIAEALVSIDPAAAQRAGILK